MSSEDSNQGPDWLQAAQASAPLIASVGKNY